MRLGVERGCGGRGADERRAERERSHDVSFAGILETPRRKIDAAVYRREIGCLTN
jgi:hypothetical protein